MFTFTITVDNNQAFLAVAETVSNLTYESIDFELSTSGVIIADGCIGLKDSFNLIPAPAPECSACGATDPAHNLAELSSDSEAGFRCCDCLVELYGTPCGCPTDAQGPCDQCGEPGNSWFTDTGLNLCFPCFNACSDGEDN